MKSCLFRTVGSALFAVTVLAFVALPFWIFTALDWINYWIVQHSTPAAIGYFFYPILFLPLSIIAILWIGFLLAWLLSRRAKSAYLPAESKDRSARTRACLLLAAGALALAVTVLVELGYLDWMGGAALGSSLDESNSALLHLYLFVEVPQFFLVLLWTPFLLLAWLPRPNSLATTWRLCLPLGFLLLVVTRLVWMGYPDWVAGVGMLSIANKRIPADAFYALKAVPALFVACVWLCFFWFLSSSLRAHSQRALGPV